MQTSLSARPQQSVHADELESLYFVLIASRFAFVGRVVATLDDIYAAVRREHPSLCIDVPCRCGGAERPDEWKHQVRRALDRLSSWGMIARGSSRGTWMLAASSRA